jgi:hypothetical protein
LAIPNYIVSINKGKREKKGKRGNDPQNTTITEVGGNTIYWFG